jgi:hypothetical protein
MQEREQVGWGGEEGAVISEEAAVAQMLQHRGPLTADSFCNPLLDAPGRDIRAARDPDEEEEEEDLDFFADDEDDDDDLEEDDDFDDELDEEEEEEDEEVDDEEF